MGSPDHGTRPRPCSGSARHAQVTTDSGCSASAFFGSGGAASPDLGLRCDAGNRNQSDAALILRRNVSLAVGATVEFAFVYGYVPGGAGAQASRGQPSHSGRK